MEMGEPSEIDHHHLDSATATATASTTATTHHLNVPAGLSQHEFDDLKHLVFQFHTYELRPGQCSSLLSQLIRAPRDVVWSVVRRFDKPQIYKHFIKSCSVAEDFIMTVGCTRDVYVISGLPAATSTERLDILDDDQYVTGFSITGGDHRLRNYRSVTTVHEMERDGQIWTVVLESYIVDVPEGNTEEDTRLFADTVVKLNLQKLTSVTEGMARAAAAAAAAATATATATAATTTAAGEFGVRL
ncbi:abscisic acid receptor PYR1-like isoform X1 [Cucurbita moschata]|uniref:Abscisic acid receptor PYR1-like isoform X1 n=1 Tax=Cucurbita moschata TaxID=3662 RepID=A0A6J1HKK0_CUCMO|nr:abscisic acid receptor PYR1-like isoform X1 [Cucurbita moschata]